MFKIDYDRQRLVQIDGLAYDAAILRTDDGEAVAYVLTNGNPPDALATAKRMAAVDELLAACKEAHYYLTVVADGMIADSNDAKCAAIVEAAIEAAGDESAVLPEAGDEEAE